jgi:phosphatidylglycerol lysyltransferase
MAPMGFLVQVEPFHHSALRRSLAAYRDGVLVGFLSMAPIYARRGWLVDDLLRDANAPNGTAEALFDAAMRLAEGEGSPYVTMGLAPLAGPVHPWLRSARALGAWFYDFGGLWRFKAKLRPDAWDPVYVVRPPGQSPWLSVWDVLVAFTPHGIWRFAWETLCRGPRALVRGMTLALVPWTIALAWVPTARWFPSPAVHAFWVAFDVTLLAALSRLWSRWRQRLALRLAVIVSLDALITAAELLAFPGPSGGWATVVRCVAVGAPSLAAATLWAAWAHRR